MVLIVHMKIDFQDTPHHVNVTTEVEPRLSKRDSRSYMRSLLARAHGQAVRSDSGCIKENRNMTIAIPGCVETVVRIPTCRGSCFSRRGPQWRSLSDSGPRLVLLNI